METELSQEAEEYIEAIYRLENLMGVAKTKTLAEGLHVVPGSITNTIEHLEKHNLVAHEPYRGVKLTAKGKLLALDILRKHRLAERLLTDVLHAEWCDVHESACKLEHALSKEVVMLLEEKLEHPKVCPHGNPIPSENGRMEEEESLPLLEISLNETFIIAKITDERRQTLITLANIGMKPGASVHIVRRKSFRTVVCVAGKEHALNNDDIASVWVKPVRGKKHAFPKKRF